MNFMNPTMMACSYRSSFLDLPVALVDCQVEGCPMRLHHVFKVSFLLLNYIDFDRGERKIC